MIGLVKNPLAIAKQILIYLYFARMLQSYQITCRSLYRNFSRALDQSNTPELRGDNNNNNNSPSSAKPIQQQQQQSTRTNASDSVDFNPTRIYELTIPRLWHFLLSYEKFSTYLMIFVAFKTALPFDYLLSMLFTLEKPGNCYVPGRMVVFYPPMIKPISLSLSLAHLCWRYRQTNKIRHYSYHVFTFMLEPDQSIKRFHKLLARRANDPDWSSSIHDLHLRSILCYPVHYTTQTKYRPRANRTLEAKSRLRQVFNRCTLVATGMYLFLVTIFLTAVFVTETSDLWYINSYPGCAPDLEQAYSEGKLALWSFKPSVHRLSMMVFDIAESMVIWIDSGVAVTFVLGTTYVINDDMVACWRSIHRKLELTYHRFQQSDFNLRRDERAVRILNYARQVDNRFLYHHIKPEDERTQILAETGTGKMIGANAKLSRSHFDEESINEIQLEICDCFEQIEASDSLVSDIITASLIFWFYSLAIFTYYSSFINFSLFVRVLECSFFVTLTFVSSYLLRLHRSIHESYPIICSFMARDKSKYKTRFIRVLEFYTKRNRTTYTLFQQYHFIPSSYMTILGYTISCATIIENLWSRRTINNN